MTNRKRLSRVICAVLTLSMLLALSACSTKSSSTPSTTSLSTEPITLNFWDMTWGTTKYNDEGAKLSAAYSKVAKNITVKYTVVPWANRYENFSVAIASGTAPDVSTGGGFQQHQFAKAGKILSLDSIVAEWKTEGKLNDFPKGLVDYFKLDGIQIGIPFNMDLRGIWYRTDLFKAKGLEVPKTFDDIYKAAVALTDPSKGMYGMVYPVSDSLANTLFANWFTANDSGVWTKDFIPDWTNPKNLEVLNFISKMRDAKVFPAGMASYTEPDAQKLFLAGNAAMLPFSMSMGNTLATLPASFADNVALMPAFKGPSATEPGTATALNALMAYKSTKYPEQSKAFLKWWSENNFSLWTVGDCAAFPARTSFQNKTEFSSNKYRKQALDGLMPYVKSLMYPAPNAISIQGTLDGERWWRDVSQAVMIGQKSNDQILKEMQARAVQLVKDSLK